MNVELQSVFEYMEKERGIDREVLIQAVETALQGAAKKGVIPANEVHVKIDRNTFDIKAYATKFVVEDVKAPYDQIAYRKARLIDPKVEIGQPIEVEVTTRDFGRIAAQTAKQAIMHKLRQAEKEIVFDEYKDRSGDIITGTVRRFDRNDVIIDLGRGEGVMPSRERVPVEEYQVGERIRAYIVSVNTQSYGPEIVLSRSHPELVRRLFELEVSEIADGTVEIKGIAREAGFRTKIAVLSHDEKVDPVGACVGMRGIRVKNIVRELSGEKIDIVRWSDDIETFVTNALAPAQLMHLDINSDHQVITVTVDSDQLSLAIGKKGQNARLTAKLTGWKIDIQKDQTEVGFEEKVAQAVSELALVESIGTEYAELLVRSGFLSLEGIVAAEVEDLAAIDGIDEPTAAKIRSSAESAYDQVPEEPEM